MVSTRSRAGVNKQADAGPSKPTNITPDLDAILDGQAKMQQELADLKKRNADEMEALRQENSRLRRKIEADPTLKGKAKEASEAARSPDFHPIEEESEYNPTPHTFTTTQQTPIPSTHPTHFPSTQPGHTAAPTPAATLPTTQIPYNILTTLHTTHVPPYNPHYLPATHIPPHNFTSTFPTLVNHPIPPIRYHPNNPDVATPSPTSSPTPPSCLMGTLHTGPLHRWNRPWWTPQSLHHPCRPVHVLGRGLLQGLPHHPQGSYSRMVHNPSTLLHRQLWRTLPYVLHPFC